MSLAVSVAGCTLPIVSTAPTTDLPADYKPWPALWAMVIGFFMILLDTTIVSVATPAIMEGLGADVSSVIWVTSAYLLAYAVPLLITGRLGDRFGPKNVYLVGLAVFTLSSLWCGLTNSIEGLIIARIFQGFGASMMSPQTMAVITRTFPAHSRGQAMALWGATAGVAMLVGPLLGGVLVDSAGWEWIFIINVPVGIVAAILAIRLVPKMVTHSHSFDILGVVLSAVALFCIVFGIQEGEKYSWGRFTGFDPPSWIAPLVSVPGLIGVGVVVFLVFIWWQARNHREPLVPLTLFGDRNFSMANIGIATVSFAVTALSLPFMFWAQGVRGWSPTESAMLLVPMAVLSAGLAPVVGKLVDRVHPRSITLVGFVGAMIAVSTLSFGMTPDSAVWRLLLPLGLLGIANACLWAPLSATATRNLPMSAAGAGAGVYNTTRQFGAVLGSAGIAGLMQARLAVELPGSDASETSMGVLPPAAHEGFSAAMSQAMLLPAGILVVGILAVLFFQAPTHARSPAPSEVDTLDAAR